MAVQQFTIFVYLNNKPRTLDVAPYHRSEDVLNLLRDKLSKEKPPVQLPQEDVFLKHRSSCRPWDVKKTLAENGVESESSHEVYRPPNPIDDEVTKEMLSDLAQLSEHLPDKSFVFIGIGSYVNARPEEPVNEESIKRQQCRDSLIAWCKKQQWSLTVVLIDPGFQNAGPDAPPQIYDLDQGWRLAERKQGGKIRVYGRTDAPTWRLISYGTGIKEYSLIASLTNTQKIAELPIIPMLANKIQMNGFAECCVASGNFYAEPTPSGQYCTIGNPEFLRTAGFVPSSSGFNPQPD